MRREGVRMKRECENRVVRMKRECENRVVRMKRECEKRGCEGEEGV